jgi:hypothetical protein
LVAYLIQTFVEFRFRYSWKERQWCSTAARDSAALMRAIVNNCCVVLTTQFAERTMPVSFPKIQTVRRADRELQNRHRTSQQR